MVGSNMVSIRCAENQSSPHGSERQTGINARLGVDISPKPHFQLEYRLVKRSWRRRSPIFLVVLAAVVLGEFGANADAVRFGDGYPYMDSASGSSRVAAKKADEDANGMFYAVALPAGSPVPSVEDVIAGEQGQAAVVWAASAALRNGMGRLSCDCEAPLELWVASTDADGQNPLGPGRFFLPDDTAPVIDDGTATATFSGASTFTLTMSVDQFSTVDCVIVEDGAAIPSPEAVRAGLDSSQQPALLAMSWNWVVSAQSHSADVPFNLGTLDPANGYTVVCTSMGRGLAERASNEVVSLSLGTSSDSSSSSGSASNDGSSSGSASSDSSSSGSTSSGSASNDGNSSGSSGSASSDSSSSGSTSSGSTSSGSTSSGSASSDSSSSGSTGSMSNGSASGGSASNDSSSSGSNGSSSTGSASSDSSSSGSTSSESSTGSSGSESKSNAGSAGTRFDSGFPVAGFVTEDTLVLTAKVSEATVVAVCIVTFTDVSDDSSAPPRTPTLEAILSGYCSVEGALVATFAETAVVNDRVDMEFSASLFQPGVAYVAFVAAADDSEPRRVVESVAVVTGITRAVACSPAIESVTVAPASASVTHLESVRLNATTEVSPCSGDISYQWTAGAVLPAGFAATQFVPESGSLVSWMADKSRNRSYLVIPGGLLQVGAVYSFIAEASLAESGQSVTATSRVTVVPTSRLVAVIRGDPVRSIERDELLVLDARDSRDLDGVVDDELQYHWSCIQHTPAGATDSISCPLHDMPSEAVVEVGVASELAPGLYTFVLNLTKGTVGAAAPFHFRQASVEATVKVVSALAPHVAIPGERERVAVLSPNHAFQLAAQVSHASGVPDSAPLVMEWSAPLVSRVDVFGNFVEAPAPPDIGVTLPFASPLDRVVVSLAFDDVAPGTAYTFELRAGHATALSEATNVASATVTVIVPFGPIAGDVVVSPREGAAAVTEFALSAPDWTGAPGFTDLPLRYRFLTSSFGDSNNIDADACSANSALADDGDVVALSEYSGSPDLDGVRLPAGPASSNYTILVAVDVINAFGAQTVWTCNGIVTTTARVTVPTLARSERVELFDSLQEQVLGPALAGGQLSTYFGGLASVFSVLNAPLPAARRLLEGTAALEQQRVRRQVIETLDDAEHDLIAVTALSKDRHQLMAQAFSAVLAVPDEVDSGTQVAAIRVANESVVLATAADQLGRAAGGRFLNGVGSLLHWGAVSTINVQDGIEHRSDIASRGASLLDTLTGGLARSLSLGGNPLLLRSPHVWLAAARDSPGALRHLNIGSISEVVLPQGGWGDLIPGEPPAVAEVRAVWYTFDVHHGAEHATAPRALSGTLDVNLLAVEGDSALHRSVSDAAEPITLVVPIGREQLAETAAGLPVGQDATSVLARAVCAYWDDTDSEGGRWSLDGLAAAAVLSDGAGDRIVCRTSHLTQFRVQAGELDFTVRLNDIHPIQHAGLVVQRYGQPERALVTTTLSIAVGVFGIAYCWSVCADRKERKALEQKCEALFVREGTMARPARLDRDSLMQAFKHRSSSSRTKRQRKPSSRETGDGSAAERHNPKHLSLRLWSPRRDIVVPAGKPNVVQLFAGQLSTMFVTLMKREHVWWSIFSAPVDARMCVSRPQRVLVLASTFASGMAAAALFLPLGARNETLEGVAWQNHVAVGLLAGLCLIPARTLLPLLFKRANTLKASSRRNKRDHRNFSRKREDSPSGRRRTGYSGRSNASSVRRSPATSRVVDSDSLASPDYDSSSPQSITPPSCCESWWVRILDGFVWLTCGACCCQQRLASLVSRLSLSRGVSSFSPRQRLTPSQRLAILAALAKHRDTTMTLPSSHVVSSGIASPEDDSDVHSSEEARVRPGTAAKRSRSGDMYSTADSSASESKAGLASHTSTMSLHSAKSEDFIGDVDDAEPAPSKVEPDFTPVHPLQISRDTVMVDVGPTESDEVDMSKSGSVSGHRSGTARPSVPPDDSDSQSDTAVIGDEAGMSKRGAQSLGHLLTPTTTASISDVRADVGSMRGSNSTRHIRALPPVREQNLMGACSSDEIMAMPDESFLSHLYASRSEEEDQFGCSSDLIPEPGLISSQTISDGSSATLSVTSAEALVLSASSVLHQLPWEAPIEEDEDRDSADGEESVVGFAADRNEAEENPPAARQAPIVAVQRQQEEPTAATQQKAPSVRVAVVTPSRPKRASTTVRVQMSVLVALVLLPFIWAGASAAGAALIYVAAVRDADTTLAGSLALGGLLLGVVAWAGFHMAKNRRTVFSLLCLAGAIVVEVIGGEMLLSLDDAAASSIFLFLVVEEALLAVLLWMFSASLASTVRRTEAYLQDTHNTVATLFKVIPSVANEFVGAVRTIQRRYRRRYSSKEEERAAAIRAWLGLKLERMAVLVLLYAVVIVFLVLATWICIIAGAAFDEVQSRAWVVASLAAFFADTMLLQPLQLGVRAVLTFLMLMRDGTDRPMMSRVVGKCTELLNRACCAVLVFFD